MYKLKYKIRDDGTYSATGVIGFTSTIRRLDIPAVHKRKPVTEVSGELLSKLTALKDLVLPHCITKIDIKELRNNESLHRIEVAQDFSTEKSVDSVLPLFISIDGVLYSNYGKTLTKYPAKRPAEEFVIPDSVTSIGDNAFRNCSKLTGVTIGNGVTYIGDYAFCNCPRLTEVTIPDSVTSIGDYAFSSCNSALYTEYEYGRYVGNDNNPYALLYELTNKNFTTYKIHEQTKIIGHHVFSGCGRLSTITIPDSVTSIGMQAFDGCTSLTSVYITDLAAWCEIQFATYASNPLCYAKNLYLNNELVTELVIPDSVTSTGNWAFAYCSSLTSVTIGNGVTSIGDYAFSGCSRLTGITIGNGVTSIGGGAFNYCSRLNTVYYNGTADEWGDISIYYGNDSLKNATRYYYSESEPTEAGN